MSEARVPDDKIESVSPTARYVDCDCGLQTLVHIDEPPHINLCDCGRRYRAHTTEWWEVLPAFRVREKGPSSKGKDSE